MLDQPTPKPCHPLRPGERLCFEDGYGNLDDTNGWPMEVDEAAHFDGDMPFRAFAIDLNGPSIRDITDEFDAAVRDARRAEAPFPSSYVIREGRAA